MINHSSVLLNSNSMTALTVRGASTDNTGSASNLAYNLPSLNRNNASQSSQPLLMPNIATARYGGEANGQRANLHHRKSTKLFSGASTQQSGLNYGDTAPHQVSPECKEDTSAQQYGNSSASALQEKTLGSFLDSQR